MSTAVDIGTLIERSPEIRKGRPCIAGTGVSVRRIAGWHNLGLTPEEIAAKIEHLTLAQIHAALTYYHANRDEIDSDIADSDRSLVLEQCIAGSEPAHLAKHAFQLAQEFANFYHRHHILTEENPARKKFLLATAAVTLRELVRALALLGIESPEAM